MGGEWQSTTIGEHFDLVNGYAFKSKEFLSKGVPVIKIKNVKAGYFSEHEFSYVASYFLTKRTDKLAKPGDLLITMSGNRHDGSPSTWVGKVAYFDKTEPFFINQRVGALRLKSESKNVISRRFMAYLLSSWYFQELFISIATSSGGQANISPHQILSAPFKVPSYTEQRAIAHILGTLDDKIELNRQMNRTLEAMAQALFKSFFLDFDPVVVNALRAGNPVPEKFAQRAAHYRDNPVALRLPEDTLRLFPDRFRDSKLGPIPEGWNATTIGAEFDLTMGQSPPGSTYNEQGEGLPFFQGRRDFGFRYPSNRVYCNAPTRIAHAGDTLVSVRAPVGDINMAYETCCVGRGVAAIRHKSGGRSYTYYAMKALGERFKRFEAEGTVFGSINKKQFHNLPSMEVVPDIVAEFEKLASPLDENIRSFEEEMRTLSKLRDTLLPKLISGELRVPDAEKLLEDTL